MKRALAALGLLFGLVLVTTRANSQLCPTVTVNNNLPDTVKVGYGGTLDLSASWVSEDTPLDSCAVTFLHWSAVTGPVQVGPTSIAGASTTAPDSGVDYTTTWRPPDPGTYRITPYAANYNTPFSLDTTVVIVKEGLWYPDAFHYRGAFRVPANDGTGGDSYFSYKAGHMMAYHPTGEDGDSDGYEGSLYMNGIMHELDGPNKGGEVARLSIPAPVISSLRQLSDLNTATFIHNFVDPFGPSGWKTSWKSYPGPIPKPGDMVYAPSANGTDDFIYFTFRDTYTSAADYYSLGRFPADLDNFAPQGLWHLGPVSSQDTNPYHYRSWADYLFYAPLSWATTYTGGRQMISGMGDREAGTNGGSRGPSMYAWSPYFGDRDGTFPQGGAGDTAKIAVTRLLHYPPNGGTGGDTSCDSTYGTHAAIYTARRGYDRANDYSLTDSWSGGSWITHNGRQAIVFVGSKCNHHSHYFQPGGSLPCGGFPCAGIDNGSGWTCGDSTSSDPAYRTALYFYDPDDIAQVALGNLDPWDPQPYAALSLTDVQWNTTECAPGFGDIEYDATNGRIYMSQPEEDGVNEPKPLIHVFDITPWESYVVSMSITSEGYAHVGDSLQVIFDWDLQTTADCTFATDTTSVASISIVMADSVYFTDTAPLASLPPYEKKVYLGTNGIAAIKGRINIDASGTDCDGQFDSNVRSVYVAP